MPQLGNAAQNIPSKLISSLFTQKGAGKYCDMTLKFGEVEKKAHACVVASFSPFVDKWMSSGGVIASPVSVPLQLGGFSCLDCATKVIDFMYLGKIQIDNHHLEHILAASEALQVPELLQICRKHSNKNCIGDKTDPNPEKYAQYSLICNETEKIKSPSKSLCNQEIPTSTSSARLTDSCNETFPVLNKTIINDDDIDAGESEWCGVKCPKCNIIFMSLAKYQQHCSTHLGKTLTTCYVCNFASIRVSDVIKHLLEENHGEKVCSICLLELSSNQSLKDHLQVHHQTLPFLCLTCNTRFQTRTALHSHIVRHTNETPFVCKECGRGFKWKHGLQNHMVTHSKLKTFLCDECGYSTAHLRSFIDHKTIHSGEKFKCPKPDCQFISVRKESVKHHLMTHSKEKPYQCEVCGQAFSQAKNLRRHATSHDPLTDPEKCPLCPYQTFRNDKFKVHFKQYHKDGEIIGTKRKQKMPASSNTLNDNKEQSFQNNLSAPAEQDSGLSSRQVRKCKKSAEDAEDIKNMKSIPNNSKSPRSGKSKLILLHSQTKKKSQNRAIKKTSFKFIEKNLQTCERLILPKYALPNDCNFTETLANNCESRFHNLTSAGESDNSTVLLQTIGFKPSSIIGSGDDVILMLNEQTSKDNIPSEPNPTDKEEILIFGAEEVLTSTSGECSLIPNGSLMIMDPDCLDSQATFETRTNKQLSNVLILNNEPQNFLEKNK